MVVDLGKRKINKTMKKLKEFILNDTVQEVIAGICFMSLLVGFLLMCLAVG